VASIEGRAPAGRDAARLNYRLNEVTRQWDGLTTVSVFAEHKDIMGLTVRATVGNPLGGTSLLSRTVYVGLRTGPVAFLSRGTAGSGLFQPYQCEASSEARWRDEAHVSGYLAQVAVSPQSAHGSEWSSD
jgi:hypothetical protein